MFARYVCSPVAAPRTIVWAGLVLLVCATVSCSKGSSARQDARPDSQSAGDAELTEVSVAIERAAGYLARHCDVEGKFTYQIRLEADETDEADEADAGLYNVLRHAGAVYALAQYCQVESDPAARAAMLRGASFLRERCLAPVAGNANLLAAWSEPALTGRDEPRQAKLGGAALALVALLSVEEVVPDSTPLDQLRGLGRFLVFMQKSDGSFYSKFFPQRGRSDVWQSMYYPGEAALGLVMLYQRDPAPQWLHTATKALRDLAQRGVERHPTLPDQWYLLTVARWLPRGESQVDPELRELVLQYTRRLCGDMLHDQLGQLSVPQVRGCYTPEGRSCPSATRLEGLLAALSVLPSSDESLKEDIRQSVRMGMRFLIRCQIDTGPHLGAVARIVPGYVAADLGDAEKSRASEVRIDYVQHALSAMLAYRREFSRVVTSPSGTGSPAAQ